MIDDRVATLLAELDLDPVASEAQFLARRQDLPRLRADLGARLAAAEIQERLAKVPGWALAGDAIERTFRFPTFAAAIAFVDKVAAIADAADHHPDILVRYDRVTLTISTHSAGGLTERDFALAGEIETVAP